MASERVVIRERHDLFFIIPCQEGNGYMSSSICPKD